MTLRLGFSLDEEAVWTKIPAGDEDAAEFEIQFVPGLLYDKTVAKMRFDGPKVAGPLQTLQEWEENSRFYDAIVRWGVRGHRGLADKKGREIPCLTVKDAFDGETYEVISVRTLDLYRRAGLLYEIGEAVMAHQTLSAAEKKRSPSASSLAPSNSSSITAPTPSSATPSTATNATPTAST